MIRMQNRNKGSLIERIKNQLFLMFNTYLLGPTWAKYLLACKKYRFLQVNDSRYSVVSSKRPIAMFQAKHGIVGLLAETENNLFIRELIQNRTKNTYHVAERVVPLAEHSAIFIPMFKGKFVVYSVYRYALHKYCYEFLRSVDNIFSESDDALIRSFERCSGLQNSDIRSIVYLGDVCPDSTMSHNKVAVYAVVLDSFNFESIVSGKSSTLVTTFHRNFDKVECLSLHDLYQYIDQDKFFDGVSLGALNLWIAYLLRSSSDSLIKMLNHK